MTMNGVADVTDIPPGRGTLPDQQAAGAPAAPAGGTVAERLAAARTRKDDREAKLAEERQLAELERLELEERFARETNGKIDRDFAIVDVSDIGEGFIVVKLGADVIFKSFRKTDMENEADIDAFVIPCLVYPSADDYRMLVKRRAFVAHATAVALGRLYGVRNLDQGKK